MAEHYGKDMAGAVRETILETLVREGPLTGAELLERTRTEVFALWKACKSLDCLRFQVAGRRFLRLDRAVPGYARLSPSIRREFLTYTVLGLDTQADLLAEKAARLDREIRAISQSKLELARESMESAVSALPDSVSLLDRICFIIAGDITYDMSHLVPRPEKSTGEMVRGSDLDIVIVAADDLSAESVKALDRAVYRKKHFLLVHPEYREEIDYLVKRVSRVKEQLRFDTFESMVASKILWEGQLLYGSPALFDSIKRMVDACGVPAILEQMTQAAERSRDQAAATLLNLGGPLSETESYHLFYTREEGEEIY